MKRIISTLLVCVLLLGCVLTLASCGKKLSGTYASKVEAAGQSAELSFTFKGKNVVIETKFTVLGQVETKSQEATYSIDGDEITFTYEEDGEEKVETMTFEQGEKDGVKYIKIAGVQYDKQ